MFEKNPENFVFQLFVILELFCNLLLPLNVASSIALSIAFFAWNRALHPSSLQTTQITSQIINC